MVQRLASNITEFFWEDEKLFSVERKFYLEIADLFYRSRNLGKDKIFFRMNEITNQMSRVEVRG